MFPLNSIDSFITTRRKQEMLAEKSPEIILWCSHKRAVNLCHLNAKVTILIPTAHCSQRGYIHYYFSGSKAMTEGEERWLLLAETTGTCPYLQYKEECHTAYARLLVS
ncbi:hypothetical protein CHARACLAT_024833 [Characodon lateralis]|uniref:Uncharacterized protein n=1 Tax=Characodon lateralis TaxID=208331 RepID=A0ABU7DU34_9TELE|nr:hypothetical protein [Characodon lateralis]